MGRDRNDWTDRYQEFAVARAGHPRSAQHNAEHSPLHRRLDSLVFGVYTPDTAEQLAFARVITDYATFGWLCDVYVTREARGRASAPGWRSRSSRRWRPTN
ncbi:hypothetical protein [Streptomyces sp. NPDC058424]|uniref:hypothetical protein n=1 Tax=Streptomyces sp. NPDC058424 TaxID=3346491 RepID=UPI003652A900